MFYAAIVLILAGLQNVFFPHIIHLFPCHLITFSLFFYFLSADTLEVRADLVFGPRLDYIHLRTFLCIAIFSVLVSPLLHPRITFSAFTKYSTSHNTRQCTKTGTKKRETRRYVID